MLFGSLFAIYSPKQPSKNLAHAIQHLAAGILLSAIALELIPTIAAAKGFNNLIGIIVGFSLGAMVMIALPLLLKEDEKDEETHQKLEDECEEGRGTENQMQVELPSKPHFPESENPSNPSGLKKVKVICRKMKSRLFHLFDSCADHSSANIASEDISPFPAVFAAAVYIDSAMDGLLVGISLLSGARFPPVAHALHHPTLVSRLNRNDTNPRQSLDESGALLGHLLRHCFASCVIHPSVAKAHL
jgi:hypothetical protein